MGFLQLLRDAGEGIVQSDDISPGISSKRYTMAYSAFQGNIKVMPETIKGKFHLKATITAKRDWLGRFHLLAGGKNHFTGILFFRIVLAQNFHTAESFRNLRMSCNRLDVCFKATNIACLPFNLRREVFQEFIFHAVLLALVVSF